MEHLLDYFIPAEYKLSLFLDKHQKTLSGTETISGHITPTGLLKLHTVGQEITNLKINDKSVDFTVENGLLTAVAPADSDVIVNLAFHGSLNENMQGAYLSSYLDPKTGQEERIISTQFESHYAREAFPCVDEPAAKAIFSLEISVPDADDIVLSNTPGTKAGRTWTFAPTPRMSTYLLAFVVGKFNVVEKTTKSGILVRTFAPLDQSPDLLTYPTNVAVSSLEYYENLFGLPYPLKKLDQVAIPDFEAGAMENWGLVTYRSSQLLASSASSLSAKKSVALTVTHELSHQWFGNLVTMSWWNDLWLNESFATIMEYYCTDTLFPEYKVWTDFFTGDCLAALSRDAIPGVQAVREDVSDPSEIATLFDPCIVYAKGARLMLMLIREMGETAFFSGIKAYFKKNAYKNTTASDLWHALNPHATFNVEAYMTAWLTQPGYPVITDEAQQRFLLDGSTDDTKYPLEEVKDDMSGHYLINLSGPEFSEALEKFPALSEEQRLRILIDRLLLSQTPIVSSSSLLPLLSKFRQETSAPIWDILNSIVGRIAFFLDPGSPADLRFRTYLGNLVSPLLRSLGLTPRSNEDLNDTDLRSTLLNIAVYARSESMLSTLAAQYDTTVSSTSAASDLLAALASLDSETRVYILRSKLFLAEKTVYPALLSAYSRTSDPELKADLRSALARPREKANITTAFSLLKNPEVLKPQDHLSFLLRLRSWPDTRDMALNWVFENWDYIVKINGEKSLEDYPRYLASTINKSAAADAFFAFFNPLSSNPVLARSLKVAKADIAASLRLIELDQAAVLRAVEKL